MWLRGHCSSKINPGRSYNKLLQGLLGVWRPWLIAGIPSCPALYHLVLGVVARAVHLVQEKKYSSANALNLKVVASKYPAYGKF